MEVALVGSLPPPLATPAPYLIVGGFRLVELTALAYCDRGKVVIYVEEELDIPLILEGCRYEVKSPPPNDVPKVHVGCVPHLLAGRTCVSGAEPLTTVADLIEKNVEFMKLALDKLKQLGVELAGGDVRGHMRGDVYCRGKIREYTYIEGPAVVGPSSEVLPFTYVRPGTVLYHSTKARDEVKNAILDAYVRKQHSGYVGDSYIAPFVNLGAGTNVSNLKNTLGLVKPTYSRGVYRKLGVVFGEFVKTAIGTSVFGGKYVGPLSHLYGVVDRDVSPLSIYRNGVVTPMNREKAREYVRRDLEQFGRVDLHHRYMELLEKFFL